MSQWLMSRLGLVTTGEDPGAQEAAWYAAYLEEHPEVQCEIRLAHAKAMLAAGEPRNEVEAVYPEIREESLPPAQDS